MQPLVSKSAVLGRVRRRLARDGERLRAISPNSYTLLEARGAVLCWAWDLEGLAREVGALRPSEEIAS